MNSQSITHSLTPSIHPSIHQHQNGLLSIILHFPSHCRWLFQLDPICLFQLGQLSIIKQFKRPITFLHHVFRWTKTGKEVGIVFHLVGTQVFLYSSSSSSSRCSSNNNTCTQQQAWMYHIIARRRRRMSENKCYYT